MVSNKYLKYVVLHIIVQSHLCIIYNLKVKHFQRKKTVLFVILNYVQLLVIKNIYMCSSKHLCLCCTFLRKILLLRKLCLSHS